VSLDGSPRLIQLPASWKPVNALTTVAGYHEQYYMEFLKQYGMHLICSAVAQSPFDLIRICFARLTRQMQSADVLTFDQIAGLDDIHQSNTF
jgi:hypothetical protein